MKLYYSPGACSLCPHIVLREAGYTFDLERVDLMKKKTQTGADYLAINPNGYVPALVLDDGEVMTEASVIVQYLADGKPDAHLAPRNGTIERYRLMEWLNFVATEVHKQFSPLFAPTTPDETKKAQRDRLANRFAFLEKRLAANPFLTGQSFTVADAYLFTVLRWTTFLKVDLEPFPAVRAFVERVGSRPKVKEAIEAEGR